MHRFHLSTLLSLVLLSFLFCLNLEKINAQAPSLYGNVSDKTGQPLEGVNVYWQGTQTGTTTGEMGDFKLEMPLDLPAFLITSYVGFDTDTIEVVAKKYLQLKLQELGLLDEVTISQERDGIQISSISIIKTEGINQNELRKAACCDLAGCFDTQSSVQPQTTNVITNAKELRILGLSGVYNQVLIDGFPSVQGLNYTYGISSIPGTLVQNIYVAKGANSVLQGFESISGQVNVITQEPDEADKLLLNIYVNSFLEKQVNANYAFTKNKWSNLTAFQTVQPANKFDRDKDGFLDLPRIQRYMLFNKWRYGKNQELGWSSMISARLLHENRTGGQIDFEPDLETTQTDVYGQTVAIRQAEVSSRTNYRFSNKHNVVLFASSLYQQQNSRFGLLNYAAQQRQIYVNAQHEFNYGASNSLKTGVSLRHLNLNEDLTFPVDTVLNQTYGGNYLRNENIVGVFAENSYSFLNETLSTMLGVRADYHNDFGLIPTLRAMLKYNATPRTTLRASVGTGWRSVNFFSENVGLLTSSRDIIFTEDLKAERAINFGVNAVQKFERENLTGYISGDFYNTFFQNQIFPDYDADPTKAYVSNFEGESRSHAFQTDVFLKIDDRFETKLGYNYLDVYRLNEAGEKTELPFNARHKLLASFGYQPVNKKFRADLHLHWYGKKRLPDTRNNPVQFQRPDYSEPYAHVNAQFTYNFKRFEVYTGCENIFDFRQEQPILSWEDPFSPYFDTSSVWGPTRGREFYLGVRFRLER